MAVVLDCRTRSRGDGSDTLRVAEAPSGAAPTNNSGEAGHMGSSAFMGGVREEEEDADVKSSDMHASGQKQEEQPIERQNKAQTKNNNETDQRIRKHKGYQPTPNPAQSSHSGHQTPRRNIAIAQS